MPKNKDFYYKHQLARIFFGPSARAGYFVFITTYPFHHKSNGSSLISMSPASLSKLEFHFGMNQTSHMSNKKAYIKSAQLVTKKQQISYACIPSRVWGGLGFCGTLAKFDISVVSAYFQINYIQPLYFIFCIVSPQNRFKGIQTFYRGG